MANHQIVPAYKGDLAAVAPARVLYRLAAAKETGILQFTAGDVVVNFLLMGGDIEDVHSKNIDYNLVGHMLRMGRITQEQIADVTTVVTDFGGRVIDTFVSLNILKSFEVIQVYNEFVKVVTAEVVQFQAGSYVFFKYTSAPPPSQSPVRVATFRLVLEATRSIADWSFFDGLFHTPEATTVNALNNPRLAIDDLKPGARDLRIFKLVEGGGTVQEILFALKVREPADKYAVLSFLYVCLQFELITAQIPPRAAPPPEAAGETDGFDLTAEDIEPAGPDPAEIATLTAERDRLAGLDHFGRLGVTEASTDTDVKRAYLKLAKVYHPDTIPIGAPAEIRALKVDIFELINDAYKEVETADGRKRAAKSGGPAGATEEQVDIRPILEAEHKFMRAKTLLKGGRGIEDALSLLTDAVNLNAKEPEYRIFYNWALFLARGAADPTIKDQAVAEIAAALKERPNDNGWLFIAQIHKAAGDLKRAEDAFKKVLEIAPDNHIASLELRLMQKRRK